MNPGRCGYRGGLDKAHHVVPTSLLECNALGKVCTMLMKAQAKYILMLLYHRIMKFKFGAK